MYFKNLQRKDSTHRKDNSQISTSINLDLTNLQAFGYKNSLPPTNVPLQNCHESKISSIKNESTYSINYEVDHN